MTIQGIRCTFCEIVREIPMTMAITPQRTLDTSGLLCPEPVMLLHNAVRDAGVGDVIEVIATDPSTQRDIPKFCGFLGHELIAQEEREETFVYFVKKGN